MEPVSIAKGNLRTIQLGVLGVVLLIAGLVLLKVFSPISGAELGNSAQDGITLAISVVIEALPFVFLGIFLSILVQVWLPPTFLYRVLPKRALPRRVVLSLLGVLLPVCECGNVPLARGMIRRGLTPAESLTFLVAAPILNPVTILTTWAAFGLDNGILIARVLGGFLIANLIGWLYSKNPDQEQLLTEKFSLSCKLSHQSGQNTNKIQLSLAQFWHETRDLLPALFVGSAIAGLIQIFVSRDLLIDLGSHPLWSVLALMALAFVVAICSNVDAFFILAFGSAFMPGAVVAFLLFGPVIDIKMLALLRTTLRVRVLIQLTVIMALSSAAIGLAVNLIV